MSKEERRKMKFEYRGQEYQVSEKEIDQFIAEVQDRERKEAESKTMGTIQKKTDVTIQSPVSPIADMMKKDAEAELQREKDEQAKKEAEARIAKAKAEDARVISEWEKGWNGEPKEARELREKYYRAKPKEREELLKKYSEIHWQFGTLTFNKKLITYVDEKGGFGIQSEDNGITWKIVILDRDVFKFQPFAELKLRLDDRHHPQKIIGEYLNSNLYELKRSGVYVVYNIVLKEPIIEPQTKTILRKKEDQKKTKISGNVECSVCGSLAYYEEGTIETCRKCGSKLDISRVKR
jgi:hypothetical protein